MGSPKSGLVAEWKLRLIEEIIKTKHNDEILYWYRYVDDVFAVLNEKTDENLLLLNLNKLDLNIKFTMDKETNKQINYLDISIIKTGNNEFETKVYRKPNAPKEITFKK